MNDAPLLFKMHGQADRVAIARELDGPDDLGLLPVGYVWWLKIREQVHEISRPSVLEAAIKESHGKDKARR